VSARQRRADQDRAGEVISGRASPRRWVDLWVNLTKTCRISHTNIKKIQISWIIKLGYFHFCTLALFLRQLS